MKCKTRFGWGPLLKTLYLHIGDGKTGTSFLQSLFAMHRKALEDQGVLFPVVGTDHLQAEKGRVTGGNRAVVDDDDWTRHFADTGSENILISAEHLIKKVVASPEEELGKWEAWGRDLGAERIAVLLFIRDPVDHAASVFQQAFKTGKIQAASLSQFFLDYNRPRNHLDAIRNLMANGSFEVSVFNYSRCKSDLGSVAASWLGVDPETFKEAPASVVNRGLTFAELRLVGSLARIEPTSGLSLGNAFSNSLPDLKPFRVLPSEDVQKQMLEKLAPAMAEIEKIVGSENALRPITRAPDTNLSRSLGWRQWRVVLDYASGNKKRLRNVWKAMRTKDVVDLS